MWQHVFAEGKGIHEVPCEYGGVIAVQAAIDAVAPVRHGGDVSLRPPSHLSCLSLRLCAPDAMLVCSFGYMPEKLQVAGVTRWGVSPPGIVARYST